MVCNYDLAASKTATASPHRWRLVRQEAVGKVRLLTLPVPHLSSTSCSRSDYRLDFPFGSRMVYLRDGENFSCE